MASRGAWRAEVVDHRREEGRPPYEPVRRPGEPLARRGEFAVHGAEGAVRVTGADGRTRWTHTFSGRPNAAHVSGDRVLVTTDSLEYTPWGFLGPAHLLDLADGRLVAELRGERGAAGSCWAWRATASSRPARTTATARRRTCGPRTATTSSARASASSRRTAAPRPATASCGCSPAASSPPAPP
ncbi:hypothetical protein ACFT25_24805 [Streptomyces hydrogenans]|uniref:hypothetical protein n=1 Tax=Streptomyces hydrogenans TaxID=1873719 RepID=UPI003628CE3E